MKVARAGNIGDETIWRGDGQKGWCSQGTRGVRCEVCVADARGADWLQAQARRYNGTILYYTDLYARGGWDGLLMAHGSALRSRSNNGPLALANRERCRSPLAPIMQRGRDAANRSMLLRQNPARIAAAHGLGSRRAGPNKLHID